MFDSMMAGVDRNDSPGRYHLLLTSRGRSVQHGGGGESEEVARRKFRNWVDEVGTMPEPRVTLIDEETGETLTTWPEEP